MPVTLKRELLGVLEVGVRKISRLANRGTVVAMQVGDEVVLVDLASATGILMEAGSGVPTAAANLPTLPSLRVGSEQQAIELMYGPTESGFAVLIESGGSGLPLPAWLDDDGTVRPIAIDLPAGTGVQCWLPLTSRGDALLLAAGAAGEMPRLWMCREGKCAPFAAADLGGLGGTASRGGGAGNTGGLNGYFLLVPSGEGTLVGAVREHGAGVYAEVFDVVQQQRLYSLRLAEFGNRIVPVGRDGWNTRRRGTFLSSQAADESDDIIGSGLAAHELAGAIGPAAWSGRGGDLFVPLRSVEDGAVRLFGRQVEAVVRLPAQVGSVSDWSKSWGMGQGVGRGLGGVPSGLVGWSMGQGKHLTTATGGQSVVSPGAWAFKIELVGVSGGSGGPPSGGVFSGGLLSHVWSVSEGPSTGVGLADGGILVVERIAPGISAFFRVKPR